MIIHSLILGSELLKVCYKPTHCISMYDFPLDLADRFAKPKEVSPCSRYITGEGKRNISPPLCSREGLGTTAVPEFL